MKTSESQPTNHESIEIVNIYKTDEWIACIVTETNGIVIDCQITFKPRSKFEKQTITRRHKKIRFADGQAFGADQLEVDTK